MNYTCKIFLLIALLFLTACQKTEITELSKQKMSDFNTSQDNRENRIKLRDDAMQAIATHISNHQTQKDRSNLPKTGENILPSVQKFLSKACSKLKHRILIAKFAAHKRKSDKDNISTTKFHRYSTQSFNQLETVLQNCWLASSLEDDYPVITDKIGHGFSLNRGLTDKQSIKK